MDFDLNDIRIASPCPADWDVMAGDDRVRFCGECRLNVYNLSDMTRQEAEALVKQHEGRLCVRFYRRADGTLLTRDCPKGAAVLHRRRISRLLKTGVAAAVVVTLAGIFTLRSQAENLEKCPPKKGGDQGSMVEPGEYLVGAIVPPELMEGFWGPEPKPPWPGNDSPENRDDTGPDN